LWEFENLSFGAPETKIDFSATVPLSIKFAD